MRTASPLESLSDPCTRQAALAACSDTELLIAAIACNAEEIFPGADEYRASRELAEYVFNARSSVAKQRIAAEALRWVSPEYFLRALAQLADPTLEKNSFAPNVVDALLAMPHGRDLAEAVCAKVLSHRTYRLSNDLVTSQLVINVVATTTDVAMVEGLIARPARVNNRKAHLAALTRLEELESAAHNRA